ncbi:response regulator [Hymenobacter sp. BT186]|uniref:histidine kinase n=1 Tax=Hymenobacter telluris TaxID=2816474 RepID=A0A939EU44_9BACT|nr:PAS domain-containing hybrid sensor histidine kinase/response regulator [Hymenobacter telluris]MBO0356735.1 response regulator [Hymenobacter telluris]MBW3372760.1 response regulator [Hymenobacter norwichensis]
MPIDDFPLFSEEAARRAVSEAQAALAAAQARVAALEMQLADQHAYESSIRALALIPQQNPNAIVRLSAAGEVLYANPAAADILRVLETNTPEATGGFRAQLLALVPKALHTKEQHQQAVTVAEHHYLLTVVAQPEEAYATLYLTNITARQQAEQKLAEQRLFYEDILDQVPMGVVVLDTNARYLFVNPESEPDPTARTWMIGKNNAEAGFHRQIPADVVERRKQFFDEALREQREVSWEEATTKDGQQQFTLYQLRPIIEPDGQIRRLVGSRTDLTARKQAEERQRQSEALVQERDNFIRLIVDALPNVVYVADAHDVVLFRNAAFEALAARSEHMYSVHKSQAVQDQLRQIKAWRRQVLATGAPLTVELPLTMHANETCHLHVHMRPLRRASGQVDVLIVSTDITALKQAQQQAEENARAKEAFLSRMSHEIRTPLNGVLGLAHLLGKTPLVPLQQEYLAAMQQAGQHLLALVNDVLDLAKITTQPLQLTCAAFDLNCALQEAGKTVAALATQKGLLLTIEPATTSLPVLGDAHRLHQVLLNLLGNALKFTECGSVQLGVAVVHQTTTDVTLRFWVQDTGPGIAAAEQERIFEAFTQVTTDTNSSFVGTGLGLSISEQLVSRMGGVLRVCSEVGQGTTFSFTITLPLAPDALTPAPNTPSALTELNYEELRGLRVLLAEDNAVNQWIATVVLQHWNVVVEAVSNGTDALAALTTTTYDAALLDIRMPGLSGVEVTRALRQHPDPSRAQLPVIALTANAFEADQISYLAAGLDACVNKPFEEVDLCRTILQVIRRKNGTP